MGLRSSREITPLMLPQFYNLTDIDKSYEQSRQTPTSIQYVIIRLLLNQEKIKELLSLREVIKDPLNSANAQSVECTEFLRDLMAIHDKCTDKVCSYGHQSIKKLAEKTVKICGSASGRAKVEADPFVQILTLFHFSTSCLALIKKPNEESKSKEMQAIMRNINWSRIDPFDKAALADHLYADLFSMKKFTSSKDSETEKLEDIKNLVVSDRLEFLEDLSKIPTFYHNVIKPLIFSTGVVTSETEFGNLANMFTNQLLRQLKNKHYDLNLASPLHFCSESISMRYFNLGHNCSFGFFNVGKNLLTNVKPFLVHAVYDKTTSINLRMTYTSSVVLINKKGVQVGLEDTEKLGTSTLDLANKLASYQNAADYKNDFGFVVVVEKSGQLFYTTSKNTLLENILDGATGNLLRVYFFPLAKMGLFNGQTQSTTYLTTVLGRNSEDYLAGFDAAENQHTYQHAIENSITSYKVELPAVTASWVSKDIQGTHRVQATGDWNNKNLSQVKGANVKALNDEVFVDPSLKPVDMVLTIEVGPAEKIEKINSKWAECQKSKYHLKPDASDVLNLCMKYALDWNDQTNSYVQDQALKVLLPSVLVIPYYQIGKYFEIERKVSLKSMKEICNKRRVQIPTDYNVVSLIGCSTLDPKTGFFYDIYRKSQANKEVYSFFEYETRKLWDIQNPLIDLSNQAPQSDIIESEDKLDDLNFSKIRYVILQQTLGR